MAQPPLPAGFVLDKVDGGTPPLPPGFSLDQQQQPLKQPQTPAPRQSMTAALKDSLLSLAAPGGLARITDSAMDSYDKAAYKAGGAVTDLAAKALPPEAAAGIGTATNVGLQSLPMFVGSNIGKSAAPAFESVARRTMQSAIKPSPTFGKEKVGRAVDTMLEGGYSPTNSGVAAMREKIGTLGKEVEGMLAPSQKVISVAPAAQNVAGVADKSRAATMGARDAEAALDVSRSLYAHPAVDAAGTMSVQAAQAMKQANYRNMGDAAYGLGLKPAAERDAIKAATAALRKGIEKVEPSVAAPNAQISDLVNAVKVSQRRALTEGNKDLVPLGTSIAAAMNNPVAALGMYANSSAAIKAALARALYSGAEQIPGTVGKLAGAAMGAQSGTAPDPRREALLKALQEQR